MTSGIARIAGLLMLAAGAVWIVMHRDLVDAGALEVWLRGFGMWAPAGFVLLYAAGTVLFFSGALLSLMGGALFGPAWGTVWNLLGATFGATLAFLIGRGLGANWVARRLGGRLQLSRQKAGGSSLSCASYRSCRLTSSITRSVSPASRSAAMSSPRPSACCREPSPTPGSAMPAGRPPRGTARLCATAFSDLEDSP